MAWKPAFTADGLSMLNQAISGGDRLIFTGIRVAVMLEATDSEVSAFQIVTLRNDSFSVERENGFATIKAELTNRAIAARFEESGGSFNRRARVYELSVYARLESESADSARSFLNSRATEAADYRYLDPPVTGEADSVLFLDIPMALSNSVSISIPADDNIRVTKSELAAREAQLLSTVNARIQSAVSALEAKISAASDTIIDWVIGLLSRNNLILLGSFSFYIDSVDWIQDSDNGYYYAELSNASRVEFPESDDPLPLAFYSFRGNDGAAHGMMPVREVNTFARSAVSSTGRVCVIRAYATSAPQSTTVGVCYVFGLQKVERPMDSEEVVADSIAGVNVTGRQISVRLLSGTSGEKLYCAVYNSAGQQLATLATQNVTTGQSVYTFTMAEDHDFTSDYIQVFLVNSMYLPVDSYTYAEAVETVDNGGSGDMEEEETEVEYLNNEITDVSVSGNKVTATVTYIGSGNASLRYKYKSVTKYMEASKGRRTYTCNLNESYTSGNSVTITLVKDSVTLATATYPDIDESEETVADPENP